MVRRGYKKVARINAIHEGRLALKDSLDDQNNDKISFVIDDEYAPDEINFKPFLTKVKTLRKIDAIHVNLFFGKAGIFAKQASELGVNLPLVTTELFRDPKENEIAFGGLTGQWYVDIADPNDEFVKKYIKMFPGATPSVAPNGYDIIMMLRAAQKANVATNPTQLTEFLKTIKDFSGSLGTYSATGDYRFDMPVQIRIVP